MDKKDIQYLEKTFKRGKRNMLDIVWIRAFQLYNANNSPLSMNCGVCYMKVMRYLKSVTA